MKIVKFKNGKYGVRKYFFIIGYRYLDIQNADYWWFVPEYVRDHAQGTLCQAAAAMEKNKKEYSLWNQIKKWWKERDNGKPI